jgi:hypothetical protein
MGARFVVVCIAVGCGGGSHATQPDSAAPADAAMTGAFCPTGANTTSPGAATVTFDVDVGAGPTQQGFAGPAITNASPLVVSDYVYGINQYPENNYLMNYPEVNFGLLRYGGDGYSAWNWTNNADNGGNDNGFTNTDQFEPYAYGNVPTDPTYPGDAHDTHPGGAIVDGIDSVPNAQQHGIAALVTISVQDYVAATATEQKAQNAPSADFVTNKPAQAAGGGQVYQDGLVQLMSAYSAAPIFYSLDNEPNYWKSTHPEIAGTADLAFDDLVARDAAYAAAVKAAAPSALVFGPVVAGPDGMTSLDDYGDLASTNPYVTNHTDATDYYLAAMSKRSSMAGMRLVDVLDVHYYNDSIGKAGTAKGAADCEQGPRDFWDPSYLTPDTAYDDFITGWKPRVLLPRLQSEINGGFPGTRLAVTEYNNGCELQIAGGVAQADTLGIFGQYGVFAATAWPLQTAAPGMNWLVAAFEAYRDYDGHGATVGSLALGAVTSDPVSTSIYAFAHPSGARVELVAINKTDAPIPAAIRLSNACAVATATVSQLTSASAAMVPAGTVTITDNALAYTLPPNSVTTFEVR